jgi:predicted Zn-dependent protease
VSLRAGLWFLLCSLISQAHASEAPVAGRDYQSLQIASSTNLAALKKLYARYTQLPYLRLEQRGKQYVLRAGFWGSASDAKAALATDPVPGAKLRIAVLRPEALLQYNWTIAAASNANALPPPASPAPDAKAGKPVDKIATMPAPQQSARANPAPDDKAPPPAPASDIGDRLRTFNPDDFALAYDVLLSTGDLQRAYRIAQQAVAKLPQDRPWRRKLAQAAEWTQHPDVAAAQWKALFLLGDRTPDVLANVLRLSPYMEDPSVALQVWKEQAVRKPLTTAQWQEVFHLFEELSQPAEGSAFFEAQYLRHQDISLLDYAARLADNAGDDTRALNLYLQRVRLAPFSMATVLRAVTHLVRMDRMGDAQTLMQTHASQVPADAAEYWRMLGQIAWETRSNDTAQEAYARYVQTPQATVADWSRLIFLVRQKFPLEAAGLALEAWRRFGAVYQLTLALEIYSAAGDIKTQTRIYRALQGDALKQAQQEPRFLLLRAQFYQRSKQPDLAWSDLSRAMQIAPGDKDAVLSALWFLIDEGRSQALSTLLRQHAATASKDSGYWMAFAAGNQTLGRSKEALHWYGKEVQRTPQAPLLLLNYADTLEQLQQAGMAARIRRHAWLLLKQKYPSPDTVPTSATTSELLTVARLALQNRPGDPAMQQVRHMVQKMRDLPSGQSDEETHTLVLGWVIAQEQFTSARYWMWQRYTRQAGQTAPLWAESQVALQLGDTATMNRLLHHNSEAMSTYNRYDTAYALGDTPQALDIAFKGMAQQDTDAPLHDRFRQHAPGNSPYLQLVARKDMLGTLDRQSVYGEARLLVRPQLHLLAGWSRGQQSTTDTNLQTLAPGSDQLERLELQWQGTRDQGSLALFHRNELQSYMGLQATQTYRWGERINLDAGLDYRADSALSLPLQVAGYEHSIHGSIGYTLGKRHYLRASPRLSQYYTQFGDYLGSGQLLDLEAGYRIRTEYPDWRLRALLTQQDFSRNGGISADSLARLPADLQTAINNGTIDPVTYFLPDGSTSWGLCFSMGENLAGQNLQTVYSRAWRPYFDMCLRDNSRTGSGYTGTVGIVGSVTGEDHVAVELQNSDGLTTVEGPTRTLTLRYRHYF